MRIVLSLSLLFCFAVAADAQTLFVPGGTVGNSGNDFVGAGTSTPKTRVDVRGDSGTAQSTLQLVGNGVSTLLLGQDGDGGVVRGQGGASALKFWVGGYADTAASGSGAEAMRIVSNGFVGIGTSTPQEKVHVIGALRSDGSNYPGLYVFNGSTPLAAMRVDVASGILDIGDMYGSAPSLAVRLFTADVERLRIAADGNVGIGTTIPTHKLSVNGTIRAKEVIVDTDWADYVFADGYELAPLDEVEAHIREKKHLPGIPSAQDVAEQGVSLGEMQALLLAKIEELTLYQIQTKQELEQIKIENAMLHRKVTILEERQ